MVLLAGINTLLDKVLAFSDWTDGLCVDPERQFPFSDAFCMGGGKPVCLEEGGVHTIALVIGSVEMSACTQMIAYVLSGKRVSMPQFICQEGLLFSISNDSGFQSSFAVVQCRGIHLYNPSLPSEKTSYSAT